MTEFIIIFLACIGLYIIAFYRGYKVGSGEAEIKKIRKKLYDCGFWDKDGKYIEDYQYLEEREI